MKETFEFTLPDGRKVVCWLKDAARIRQDVELYGNVMLYRPDGAEVYEYVEWGSVEAKLLERSARHVGR